MTSALHARDLTMGYEGRTIGTHLDFEVPTGEFTVIIGPNACGKSTLLKSLARLLPPQAGQVLLDGKALHAYKPRELATRLGILPQSAVCPEGITIFDLVSRGRYPHQSFLHQWSRDDEAAVDHALAATGLRELASRPVEELSGGQRQRAWVAMALAQQSPLLLLDEPTTFLDVSQQIHLLDLFAHLHAAGRTLVAVLHDINHALRYASHLVVMKDGAIVAQGHPAQIISPELLREVFDVEASVIDDPVNAGPLIVTHHKRASVSAHRQ